MLFSKSLAVLSTLAFGALSALAAPVTPVEHALVARCDCTSIPDIFVGIQADISVHIDALTYITKDNCTQEVVAPIVADIKVVISDAIVKVKALAGQDLDVILGVGVDVSIVAQVVADLILVIFGAIRVCLNVGVAASINVLIPLFCGLGEVVGALVSAVISVCGGLILGLDVTILGLIGAVVDVIVRLNVSVLVSVLAIVL